MSAADDEMKVDLDALTAMARRLGFKGKDSSDYIHEHMTRLGYSSRRSYYKKGNSGDGGSKSAFSFFGNSRDTGDDDE